MKEPIGVSLKANNSLSSLTFDLFRCKESKDNDFGEFHWCLFGKHEGKELQVNFDGISRPELEDMKACIEIALENKS